MPAAIQRLPRSSSRMPSPPRPRPKSKTSAGPRAARPRRCRTPRPCDCHRPRVAVDDVERAVVGRDRQAVGPCSICGCVKTRATVPSGRCGRRLPRSSRAPRGRRRRMDREPDASLACRPRRRSGCCSAFLRIARSRLRWPRFQSVRTRLRRPRARTRRPELISRPWASKVLPLSELRCPRGRSREYPRAPSGTCGCR